MQRLKTFPELIAYGRILLTAELQSLGEAKKLPIALRLSA